MKKMLGYGKALVALIIVSGLIKTGITDTKLCIVLLIMIVAAEFGKK